MSDENKMNSENETTIDVEVEAIPSMDAYAEEIEQSLSNLKVGEIVKGKVLSVNDSGIIVNIGYYCDAVIPLEEVSHQTDMTIDEQVKIDDEVSAEVVQLDDGEGNVVLSMKKAEAILVWEDLQKTFEEEGFMTVTVSEAVKGGAVCRIKGVRAFIPASQLSVEYVKDIKVYVGQEIKVKIIELDREQKKVILSRRVVEKAELEQRKAHLLASLNIDDRLTGTVTRLVKFGAFVDLGGIDGLIHINDLSWTRVKHPSEVVKEGDKVEVYVIAINREKGKISLGLKNVDDDPWMVIKESFKAGQIVEGKVGRLTNFGAFIVLAPGVDGLVHISQISDKHIQSPGEVLTVGDTVKVKVLSIDSERRKIQLSIKEAVTDIDKKALNQFNDHEDASTSLKDVFGDIYKKMTQ